MADRNVSAAAGFLVEDFITSITTQLDRVQDALRIKAVNRPLTYALKELHLELKVFVDMDAQGHVMLRAAGPNEAGASTLAMDFTTITKPMIEENTISLAATRSTPLDNLGLKPEEQMRLERLGVTNLAQLDRLNGSTGASTVARMAAMPVDRLRQALLAGRPRLGPANPPAPRPPVVVAPTPPVPAPRPPVPAPRPPVLDTRPPVFVPRPPVATPRPLPSRPLPSPVLRNKLGQLLAQEDLPEAQSLAADDAAIAAGVLEVDPGTRRLTLPGSNLQHEAYPPTVRLNGEALEIDELDDDRLVVLLPHGFQPGALEVSLGDEPPHCFALVHPLHLAPGEAAGDDPWAPARRPS
ncbi:hypothetical protein H8N03_16205 [Ramlibacter sp. USB13]|uniref:Uncharacterized protein n=1 Tax=Ramlibacter cellulosilyticus TaxID=2764187 RepID=A0A923MVG6_9BURK|nr:hypothetical protein [Ramlibacter cellulosilyticus]MBC5784492.1 hypothetical protein [Ramlibacter cellulosilyticus]